MRKLLVTASVGALLATGVAAQDLVYTPINPSFGGSSFNSQHLLGIAEINRPEPPREPLSDLFGDDLSQANQFREQLESRILAQLSFSIVDEIFNGTQTSGTFDLDQTQVAFERSLDGTITLVITDLLTNGSTTLSFPTSFGSNS